MPKKKSRRIIIGVDNNADHVNKALELGIIDIAGDIHEIKDASVVIVAVPANAIASVTKTVLDLVSDKALVFDVGSVKVQVCNQIKNHPKRKQLLRRQKSN